MRARGGVVIKIFLSIDPVLHSSLDDLVRNKNQFAFAPTFHISTLSSPGFTLSYSHFIQARALVDVEFWIT